MITVKQDWERDGFLVFDEKTVERYIELKYTTMYKLSIEKFDCFYAFNNEQFKDGLKKIRPLQEGEKLKAAGYGLYGTKDGLDRLFAYYDSVDEMIKKECDPQAVYYYEYNNHEGCINWDGDLEAIKIIIGYFGVEIAKSIRRFRPCYSIDEILAQ